LATELTKKADPDLIVDGEIQADVAVNTDLLKHFFDFSDLDRAADVLIFPNLSSSNICYKLLTQLSEAHAIGPILVPMTKAVNIVQRTATVNEIVNMITILAAQAQEKKKIL